MRKLLVCLCSSFAMCALGAGLNAQDAVTAGPKFGPPQREAGFLSSRIESSNTIENLTENLTPRISKSRQLINDRAFQHAQQRYFRMESRRRMGISLQRPLIKRGHHAIETNRFAMYPWSGTYYRSR